MVRCATSSPGCAKAELLTGIEGVAPWPVQRILLITNPTLRAAPYRRG
jgi:hypothetical protein